MVRSLVGLLAELPTEPLLEEGLALRLGHQPKVGPEVQACLNNRMRPLFIRDDNEMTGGGGINRMQ